MLPFKTAGPVTRDEKTEFCFKFGADDGDDLNCPNQTDELNLSYAENEQLDILFNKLRDEWKAVRNAVEKPEDHLDELRRAILKFDKVCGLQKYNSWSHVALHEE